MSTRLDTDLDHLMRSMDPAAHASVASDPAVLREQILRQPRTGVAVASRASRGFLTSTRAKFTALGGVVTAGVAALTFVGGGSAAYAAWSATPEPVSMHDLRVAEAACAPELKGLDAIPSQSRWKTGRPPLTLSERRGDYVLLQYVTNTVEEKVQTCLVTLEPGASTVRDVGAVAGGSDQPLKAPTPQSAWMGPASTQGDPPLTVVQGVVGTDVAGVTVHAGVKAVQATVKNGQFTAVWPGALYDGTHRKPLSVDVTLKNGRVITNAPSNDG